MEFSVYIFGAYISYFCPQNFDFSAAEFLLLATELGKKISYFNFFDAEFQSAFLQQYLPTEKMDLVQIMNMEFI